MEKMHMIVAAVVVVIIIVAAYMYMYAPEDYTVSQYSDIYKRYVTEGAHGKLHPKKKDSN